MNKHDDVIVVDPSEVEVVQTRPATKEEIQQIQADEYNKQAMDPRTFELAVNQNGHLSAEENMLIKVDALRGLISVTMGAAERVQAEATLEGIKALARKLKLPKLEKECATMILDCKRVLVQQNPPMPKKESTKKAREVNHGNSSTSPNIQVEESEPEEKPTPQMRAAFRNEHGENLTDVEWEEIKTENLDDETARPMTVSSLRDRRTKRKNEIDGGQRKTKVEHNEERRESINNHVLVIQRGKEVPALGGILRVTRDQFAQEGARGHDQAQYEAVATVYRLKGNDTKATDAEETLPILPEGA